LQEIRDYQVWDAKHDINRKKSAQNNILMTNVFHPEENIHGKIICVTSRNRRKGDVQDAYTWLDALMSQLQSSIGGDNQNYVSKRIIPDIADLTKFFEQKTIVISDFFWPSERLSIFLQACNQWLARGLVIPLYTPLGKYHHPLAKKHPELIWNM
jgi:hypothetical protein